MRTHDIIVIGAGSGGLNIAGFFARLSLRVLLIDKSDGNIGGDCLNTGCIPSKALIHVANQIYDGKLANRFFTEERTHTVDIQKVIEYIKSKQEVIREHENPEYLKSKGIEYVSGEAKFLNKNTVSVNGNNFSAKNIVLATGSRPRGLSVENDVSVPLFTNENIFGINFLPATFVFIGGGPISCELGQAFSRLGSRVIILNSGSRILEKEIMNASLTLEEQFTKEGITVINGAMIEKISERKIHYKIYGNKETFAVDADAVFLGIGRMLNIENLDLENAGIKTDEKKTRLIVDDYLRTTAKNISTVGDVAGNFQFTHAAEMHAKVVIENILSPFKKKFDAKNIAWTTYTSPEIATFGMNEKEALLSGYQILNKNFSREDRAVVDENEDGSLQIYVDDKGMIQGGTMVANNAGEMVQELILASASGLPLSSLFNKVYPYPSGSRINRQMAAEFEARKLSTFTTRVLKFFYKLW